MLAKKGDGNGYVTLYNYCIWDILIFHHFRHPITSMVHGCNALVVKPAISLSPMFIVAILNRYGYARIKDDTLDKEDKASLHALMFSLVSLYPFLISCIQFIAWSFYSIKPSTTQSKSRHIWWFRLLNYTPLFNCGNKLNPVLIHRERLKALVVFSFYTFLFYIFRKVWIKHVSKMVLYSLFGTLST